MQAIPINRTTNYCQFLIVSQNNYSLTYYAEHAKHQTKCGALCNSINKLLIVNYGKNKTFFRTSLLEAHT
ncbi:hypothetical protein [Candidatus Tisiphia endosymbiont of Nemotelus nigrinus]|uniref:hypothetical protein n=1 Tax=Candidatus Tisiphia endosymbiont of Nemotelus nigrinus TaxID=3066263 RepID=UPI00312CA7C3